MPYFQPLHNPLLSLTLHTLHHLHFTMPYFRSPTLHPLTMPYFRSPYTSPPTLHNALLSLTLHFTPYTSQCLTFAHPTLHHLHFTMPYFRSPYTSQRLTFAHPTLHNALLSLILHFTMPYFHSPYTSPPTLHNALLSLTLHFTTYTSQRLTFAHPTLHHLHFTMPYFLLWTCLLLSISLHQQVYSHDNTQHRFQHTYTIIYVPVRAGRELPLSYDIRLHYCRSPNKLPLRILTTVLRSSPSRQTLQK